MKGLGLKLTPNGHSDYVVQWLLKSGLPSESGKRGVELPSGISGRIEWRQKGGAASYLHRETVSELVECFL